MSLWASVAAAPRSCGALLPFFIERKTEQEMTDPLLIETSGAPQSLNSDIIICKYFILVLRHGKFQFLFSQTDKLFHRLRQTERRPEDRCCLRLRKNHRVFGSRSEGSTKALEGHECHICWTCSHWLDDPRPSSMLEIGDPVFPQRDSVIILDRMILPQNCSKLCRSVLCTLCRHVTRHLVCGAVPGHKMPVASSHPVTDQMVLLLSPFYSWES